ncbi:MAG: glycosyltransferase [Sediminicola sp.]
MIPQFYRPESELHLRSMVSDADVVIVHGWNEPETVAKIGKLKMSYNYRLFFLDTHHRSVSDVESMERYDLSHYDGALVFGETIRKIYLQKKWIDKVWTWHEAADTDLFRPYRDLEKEGDLVWIGNWGDNERTSELMEFLVDPVKELGIKAKVYGVRYPEAALKALKEAGIEYGGWLPNYKVPEIFARYKVTVHVPRRPYVEMLPGIPTIRPFEALACGIPLICSPWRDAEGLFRPGEDYLMASNGNAMGYRIAEVLKSAHLAQSLSNNGLETVLKHHTCAHRVDELENIIDRINAPLAKQTNAHHGME